MTDGAPQPPKKNRRRFTRVDAKIPVKIVPEDGPSCFGTTVNLSACGLMFRGGEVLAAGTPCFVALLTGRLNRPRTPESLYCAGYVVWSDHTEMGIAMAPLTPMDEEELLELLRKHAKDPSRIDAEILIEN